MSIPTTQDLLEFFENADEDGDGYANILDIVIARDKFTPDNNNVYTDLLEALSTCDLDEDRKLNFHEFLTYMDQKQA